MKLSLSPMQNRALALSLVLLVILAAVAVVAVPTWLLHKRYDSYLEDYTDRLKRYRRVEALRPAIEEGIKAVEARAGRQNYLKGTSSASAAAELQGLVTKIIESNNGRIISSQAVPAKAEGKTAEPAKAAISIQMNATIGSLLQILHTLETSQPYLFVDQLTVRAGQGRVYKPVPGVEPEYQVQLTVSGYALTGGGKP
jgi:general secretion pathway protein M